MSNYDYVVERQWGDKEPAIAFVVYGRDPWKAATKVIEYLKQFNNITIDMEVTSEDKMPHIIATTNDGEVCHYRIVQVPHINTFFMKDPHYDPLAKVRR